MKPEPFGPRGRGRENGFRCPAGRPRITNSKAVAIGTAIAIIAFLFRVGCMSGGHGVKRMTGAEGSATSPRGGGVPRSTAGSGKHGIAATAAGTMAGLFPGSGIAPRSTRPTGYMRPVCGKPRRRRARVHRRLHHPDRVKTLGGGGFRATRGDVRNRHETHSWH